MHWSKSKRSDHPLASRRHTDEFLARLARQEDHHALEEVTFWLKALREAYGIAPSRKYEIADVLDRAVRVPQANLASEFAALGSRYRTFQAQRVWNLCSQFARELGATYQYLVDQYRTRAGGSEPLLEVLPLMVVRAVRALRAELKWSLLRHGPLDQLLWQRVASLYAYAEQERFAARERALYPEAPRLVSVQSEYLQILMLGISATDALPPEKQQVVELLIEECAESFGFDRAPRPGCHYFVDLAGNAIPMRLIERPPVREHVRYFGPDRAAAQVGALIRDIRARGAIPSYLNPGNALSPELVLDTLNHLVRYWDPRPPVRASERKKALARISVVHGLESIMSTVSGAARELDFDPHMESWTVENESEGGFGAVITETASDWLEIGSLLAVCQEESTTWSIASVRRVSRSTPGTIHVGVEVLSRGELKVDIDATDPSGSKREVPALLLLSSRDGSAQREELDLVLPPRSFTDGQSWVMRAFERPYALTPSGVRERGSDYELAKFRAARQGGNGE